MASTVTRGTVLDHCAESEELVSLVSALPQVCGELRDREASEERFTCELLQHQLHSSQL